ncbi:MAG TPA: hypothetical protein VJL58_09035, partial [Pyrinomonadaceae bacterium]|nr:hypothetical protein [Pyrinomonadaceae bacterium]
MKLLAIAALMVFPLTGTHVTFAATDLASYRIHLNGALEAIRDGRPGRLYWGRKDLGFIIRHESWDPVHRSVAYFYTGVIDVMENNLS